MTAPDVSIVVPACNVAGYLAAALRSALGQQGVAVEVIVVDDGSTDGTAEVIASFAGDPRLRAISQANAGISAARNAGLTAATGRHIGFLDGDDVWLEGKAARHVALLDADPQLDLTYSWWRLIDGQGRPARLRDRTRPSARLAHGLSLEGLVVENFTGNGSNVVCRKDALVRAGGFDSLLRHSCEDLDAWLRVAALKDANIALVPEVLTLYRLRPGQLTRDWRRMVAGWEAVIAKARRSAPERVRRVERRGRAGMLRYLAHTAYEAGDFTSARALVARAWWEAPLPLLRDPLCWLVTAAVAAAALLPATTHRRLDGWVRRHRQGGMAVPALGLD